MWSAAERLADEFATYVVDAFPDIVDPFVAMAGQLAATWFEESDPASNYVAVTAPALPTERLRKSAVWALSGDGLQGLTRLKGTTQRAVFDGARQTTVLNAEATKSRWLRVPRPNACEFCKLLSLRQGPKTTYLSEQSAIGVVGRNGKARGSRELGEKYHDDCYCQPVELRSTQTVSDVLDEETVKRLQQWSDEYGKARANAGTPDIKSILSAWRQLGH